jgi:xanthine dehydrogenase small subunit
MELALSRTYHSAMTTSDTFRLNGETRSLTESDPRESLLRWLKRQRHTGTKEGCADGDCGACTVALIEADGAGGSHYVAVNSCLLPVGVLPGREVLTVEALAEGETLHPVQQALVDCAGSQCGYCTPGFVMSLFVGMHEAALDDHAIAGNLCRCTGYGPIREAARRLASDAPDDPRFAALRAQSRSALPAADLPRFFSPVAIDDALALKAEHPQSEWFAGGTDLGVHLSHGQPVAPVLIALDRIGELQQLHIDDDRVRIGAGVPLSRLQSALQGFFPAIDEMLPWFAGLQVRNRATLGGNIGSASPIGDLLPVLLALDAVIHLRGPDGARDIDAADYFVGYRKTVRHPDEIIVAVTLPRRADLRSGAAKVAKRQTDDISIVAAAFALGFDDQQRVRHARLAYGGVAAIPLRARNTEALLIGRPLDQETLAAAAAQLRAEFEPLSDHRAGSDYRRTLSANLFLRFVAELRA